MKKLLNLLGSVLYIGIILWEILEFLAIPILCLIIGLWQSLPWQYYAFSIGGYFALFLILEIIMYFVCKALDKKFLPFIVKRIKKHISRHTEKE